MQSDRFRRFVRGVSVAASSSVLVLAAVGSASAHPLSFRASTGVDAGRAALIALIGRHEPFEDAASIEALVDQILLAWPGAATFAIDLLEDAEDDDLEPSDDVDDDDESDDEDEDEESDEESDDSNGDESDDDEDEESDDEDDESDDDDEDDEDDESDDDDEDDESDDDDEDDED